MLSSLKPPLTWFLRRGDVAWSQGSERTAVGHRLTAVESDGKAGESGAVESDGGEVFMDRRDVLYMDIKDMNG